MAQSTAADDAFFAERVKVPFLGPAALAEDIRLRQLSAWHRILLGKLLLELLEIFNDAVVHADDVRFHGTGRRARRIAGGDDQLPLRRMPQVQADVA